MKIDHEIGPNEIEITDLTTFFKKYKLQSFMVGNHLIFYTLYSDRPDKNIRLYSFHTL